MKPRKHIGSAIKALDTQGGDFRVGGYLVKYTSPDERDLYKEYFTKDTDFWIERGFPVKGAMTLLEHGLEDFTKVMPIGFLDMVQEDEFGLYVEAKLHDRAEYERMLKDMRTRKAINYSDEEIGKKAELAVRAIRAIVETGKVGWSSGALPQGVRVSDEGHIESWPIIEGSLTFTPAAPSGTEIAPIKSALEQLSDFLMNTPAQSDTAIDAQHKEPTTEKAVSSSKSNSINPNKGINMDFLQKLLAMIQEYMAAQGEGAVEGEAMATAVVDELKADVPEEELVKAMEDDEEVVKKLAEKAFKLADALLVKRQKTVSTLDAMKESRIKKLEREAEPYDPFPAGGSHRGNPSSKGQPRIEGMQDRAYQGWEAEDFSFAVALGQMAGKTAKSLPFNPDQKFYRAFADKAEKQMRSEKLYLSDNAIKGIMAIKSDELDYSTQAGFGDEWVPTVWADTIWERPRLDNVIQNLFASIEMPSNPYEYPVESTDPTVYLVAETKNENVLALDISTSPIPDSKIGTAKVTFTASKFGLRTMYSAELEEDGVRRLVPQFRQQATRAMQDRVDFVGINGDTATTLNINSDGETITDTSRAYLAYNGLLKQAIVTATTNKLDASGASPSLTLLRATRAKLGSAEGYNPANLAWIMDFPTYIKLLSDDAIITMDKLGDRATVATGSLGQIDGINVYVSGQMALADSDGKITQTANVVDRGRAILVHVPTWMFGYRRRIAQDLTYLPYYDMYVLTLTMRNHFVPRTAANGTLSASDDSTAVLYNLGV